MIEKLKTLISLGCDRVINDPAHLIDMLRIYSKLFLNEQPCEVCKKYHKAYFEKLEKTGLKILENMAEQKFILKDKIVINDWETGRQYSKFNMTDKDAIERLRKYPKTISQFESFPDNWEDIVFGSVEASTELEDMNVKELKEIAKDRDISLPHNAKKAEIIELLK